MKETQDSPSQFSPQETQLIEQLRQRPDMMVRMQSILHLACNQEGPLKTADEVEALLLGEMRQLGSTTLHQWAIQAEARVSQELKSQDPTVRSRKKRLRWWSVIGKMEVGERIWRSATGSYLRPLPARLGITPREGRAAWTGC
jgi:hypothetical protein